MIETHNTASLLPYFNNQCALSIKSDYTHSKPAIDQGRPSVPLLEMSASDPLTRLLKAKIVTQASSEIQSVFLLLQRDHCRINQDSMWPFNNRDVETAWQSAFANFTGGSHISEPILLKEQIHTDGTLLPMGSIFYCQAKQVFFDPSCPACAQPLVLCTDDALLEANGLQPYTTSLTRYLYCKSCAQMNVSPNFYVPSQEGCYQKNINDMPQWLEAYKTAVINKTSRPSDPCSTCQDIDLCYGKDDLAKSRIVPFSFFPNYMLMFPAPTIAAVDFLPLVSGAPLKIIAHQTAARRDPGRLKCLTNMTERFSDSQFFLFDNDKKFLEILYLKLSFLSELVHGCFPAPVSERFSDVGFSIDRIWVSLAEQNRYLPLLWNFKAEHIGVGPYVAIMPKFPKHTASNVPHFLGSAWFYALLVNQSQNVEMVFDGIGSVLQDLSSIDLGSVDFKGKLAGYPFLKPQNIFWDPAAVRIEPGWEALWERSLELGFLLLKCDFEKDSATSTNTLIQSIDQLRTQVKKMMFHTGEMRSGQAPELAPHKQEVNNILSGILEKWQAAYPVAGQTPQPVSAPSPAQVETMDNKSIGSEEDEAIYETVIISADKYRSHEPVKEPPGNVSKTPVIAANYPEKRTENLEAEVSGGIETQETIIVASQGGAADTSAPQGEMDVDLPKTMIISSGEQVGKPSPFDQQIISGGESSASIEQDVDAHPEKKESGGSCREDDLLEKTIIQHRGKKVK